MIMIEASTIASHSLSNISEAVRVYIRLEACFQQTTIRNRNGLHGVSNGHMTDDVTHVTLKGQTRDSNTLRLIEPCISKTAGARRYAV